MKKILLFISVFLISINYVYAKEKVTLSSCVDGDTIKVVLSKKEYTIRMLAIDTPESVHPTKDIEYYGKEASEYTCNLVTSAKKIEIEYDENSDKTDKYNRLLVWVFIDGELLQKKLVENGYAKVAYLYDDYKYTEELKKIQEKVSIKEIGIWNENEKNKFTNENNINESISEETLTTKINSLIKRIKSFELIDYILISILLIIIIFCGNKNLKNKAKKNLKNYFK